MSPPARDEHGSGVIEPREDADQLGADALWGGPVAPSGAPAPDGEAVGVDTIEEEDAAPTRRRGVGSFFAELPVLVLIAFVLAILLKTFLVQAFFIPSESMLPTLEVGDRVLVNKLAHEFRDPERGEVVVFRQDDGPPGADPSGHPVMRSFQALASGLGFVQTGEKDFIKRIVGMPGETIEMREGIVYVDDIAVPETTREEGGYLSRPDLVDFGPTRVPEDEYFLMGDNRPNSSDSRSLLSTIHEDDLVGRAFTIVWPLGRASILGVPDYDATATAHEG